MKDSEKLRIDKFLWCIRVFKSRTLATEACDGGRVKISGERVKPAYHVKIGDVISIQQGYIRKDFKVIALLDKRIAAKLIPDYALDVTPPEEKEKAAIGRFISYESKFRDAGRPTKKDRRLLQKFKDK